MAMIETGYAENVYGAKDGVIRAIHIRNPYDKASAIAQFHKKGFSVVSRRFARMLLSRKAKAKRMRVRLAKQAQI